MNVSVVIILCPLFTGLLVIPTCQHAKMDLVQTGENVEVEKDRLLENVGSSCVVASDALLHMQQHSRCSVQVVHGVCKSRLQQADRQRSLGRLY